MIVLRVVTHRHPVPEAFSRLREKVWMRVFFLFFFPNSVFEATKKK
jgi:hypothetical protein